MATTQEKLNIERDESRGKPSDAVAKTANRRTRIDVAAHKPDQKAAPTRRAKKSIRGA